MNVSRKIEILILLALPFSAFAVTILEEVVEIPLSIEERNCASAPTCIYDGMELTKLDRMGLSTNVSKLQYDEILLAIEPVDITL